MEDHKSNFIQEMRKKLNEYHVEKLKRIEEHQKNKDYFKQENQAKNALMKFDDTLNEEEQSSGFEDITGWSSYRPSVIQENSIGSERRSYGFRKHTICSVPSRSSGYEFQKKEKKNDMINYLKSLLTKLQSPTSKKGLKTESFKRSEQYIKNKKQQTLQQFKKQKHILQNNKNIQKLIEQELKLQKQYKMDKDKPKFETIDLNTENNPFSSTKPYSQYQKIRRKNNNKDEIDIAYEKNILQQLIRGSSANKNSLYAQRSSRGTEKFTLKNLLC